MLIVFRSSSTQTLRAICRGCCTALLLVATVGRAAEVPATQTFSHLQQQLVDDKKATDWNAFLADARKLKAFLNDTPTSGLEIARAQLQLHRPDEALREVRRFLAMGQDNAILDAPLFAPLHEQIDAQRRANLTPVNGAALAFTLDDAGILPEDIDYDPQTRRFFVSSVVQHRVLTIDGAGKQASFIEAPDHWPMLALRIDVRRRRLWASEVALDGFTAVAKADWGKSVLLEYDLDRGTLLSRHDGAPNSNLGDMVLAANGEPILSDATGGGIYRLHGGQLQRIDHGDFISPQTIALCDGGRNALVPDYVRGLAVFDLESGAVHWLSTTGKHALDGIDGLYCHDHTLLAVQNGASPPRVITFSLDASRTAVDDEHVIERNTATLGDPTHGVLVGNSFYYIANSGWSGLDDQGKVIASGGLTKAVVMRVDISSPDFKRTGTSSSRQD